MNHRTGQTLTVIIVLLVIGVGDAGAKSIEDRKWLRMESQNFTVHSTVGKSKTKELLLHLEAMFALYPALARRSDELIPTTVTVIRDEEDMESLGINADLVDGMFSPGLRRNRMIIRYQGHREDVEIALHEYVHYLVSNLVRFPFPKWYREGYAEYVSSSQIRNDRLEFGLVNAGRVRTLVENDWMPMRELMSSPEIWAGKDLQELVQAYAQSWLFVHFLYSRPEGVKTIPTEFQRYGALLVQGKDELEAFEGAFGIEIDDLDHLLQDYFFEKRQYAFSAVSIKSIKREFDPKSSRMSRAEIAVELAEFLLPDFDAPGFGNFGRFDADSARRLIDIGLHDAGTRVRAEACLARLHYAAGDFDEAIKNIEAAADAAPQNVALQIDAHRLFQTRATQGDVGAGERADMYLRRAGEIDADNPEYGFYRGLQFIRYERYAEAVSVLEVASRRAPASDLLHANLAGANAAAGNRAAATRLARELLAFPHVEGTLAEFARDILETAESD